MGSTAGRAYDDIPYARFLFDGTRPRYLAALAHLHGLKPPAPVSARVLELGCAAGDNLIALATEAPGAEHLGIDISPRQIEVAQTQAAAQGLTNVRFECVDLLDLELDGQRFDFIIAHGLFSWVPDEVRERLFGICRDHLSDHGIAYISYNTLPGWTVKEALAEMVRLETADAGDFDAKLARANGAFDTFSALFADADPERVPHAWLVWAELASMTAKDPRVLVHDELEHTNDPCYLLQFVDWAGEYGLSHFADANRVGFCLSALPAELRTIIGQRGLSWLHAQQYLDYREWRSFRASVLCRGGRHPLAMPDPARLDPVRLRVRVEPFDAGSDTADGRIVYRRADSGDESVVMILANPDRQALLQALGPSGTRTFGMARDIVLGPAGNKDADDAALRAFVMEGIARGWLEISGHQS